MSVTGEELLAYRLPPVEVTVTDRDAILYALSVGYGARPLDARFLRHTHEDDLVLAPSMANLIAHPGPWLASAGINWSGVVHAEQRLVLHGPLRAGEPLVATTRCTGVVDRGEGKPAFVTFERVLTRVEDGARLATVVQTDACRFDGGCGSAGQGPQPLAGVPERAPDLVRAVRVAGDAALLFRLNGDLNPLHVLPRVATEAGFERPILHGLASLGLAATWILEALTDGDAGADESELPEVAELSARFRAPVFPGETLALELWFDDDESPQEGRGRSVHFRLRAPERDALALDAGIVVVRPSQPRPPLQHTSNRKGESA